MSLFFISFAILILTLYLLKKRTSATSDRSHPLPPSPWRLPWIGNLHQLGSLPHQALHRLSRIHGPVMLLRLGSVPALVVSSAEAAKEVLKTHDLVFASRPPMVMANLFFYGAQDVGFAPYGESWRQAKKICVVHVLSTKRVQSYHQVIENEVTIMLRKIADQSKLGPVNLSALLDNLMYTIVSRIVLGRAYANDEFCALVNEMSELFGLFPVGDFFPKLGWLSTISGTTSRARTCFRNLDKFLDRALEDHRQKRRDNVGADGNDHEDLVDLLLSLQEDREEGGETLSEDMVKAITMDLITGGIDTSAITLEWTMAELVRNQQLLEKVKEEIHGSVSKENALISEGEAAGMVYVDAVVKETLRLHPPAPLLLPRESLGDATVLGYRIPSRSRVMVNAWAIGRDPKYWEEPEEYRPERFVNSGLDYRGQDFHFLPFGSGRRICPGLPLAMAVVKLALSNMIKMFDWEMAGGEMDMEEAPGISVRKRAPLLVVAKPRFEISREV